MSVTLPGVQNVVGPLAVTAAFGIGFTVTLVPADIALGQAIVQYHIDHWAELRVEYIIYRQRILYSPDGAWQPMPNRGSPTANHMDHVHVNYLS